MTNLIAISGTIEAGKDTVAKAIQYLVYRHSLTNEQVIAAVKKQGIQEGFNYSLASGWQVKKFAGKLKEIASILTGIEVEKFEDREFKNTFLGPQWNYETACCEWVLDAYVEDHKCSNCGEPATVHQMTVREFLQKLGTNAVRIGLHTDTWVNATFADYKPSKDYIGNKKMVLQIAGYIPEIKQEGYNYPKWILSDCRFPNEAKAVKDRNGKTARVIRGEEFFMRHSHVVAQRGLDEKDLLFKDKSGWYYRYRDPKTKEMIHVFIGDPHGSAGDHVIVEKPTSEHSSETGLDRWDFDWYVLNTKDIPHLLREVGRMLTHFGIFNPPGE